MVALPHATMNMTRFALLPENEYRSITAFSVSTAIVTVFVKSAVMSSIVKPDKPP